MKRKPTCWECRYFNYEGSGQEGDCMSISSEYGDGIVNMDHTCGVFVPINGNWEDFDVEEA